MDKILEQLRKPLVAGILGFVIGLLVGLPLLGWGLWPVEWYDAAPKHLRADVQADYLRMTIDSYNRNRDKTLAITRYQSLEEQAPEILKMVQKEPGSISLADLQDFSTLVGETLPAVPGAPTAAAPAGAAETPAAAQATAAPAAAGTAVPEPTKAASSGVAFSGFLPIIVIVMCILTVVIGLGLVYLLVLKPKRRKSTEESSPAVQAQELNRQVEPTNYAAAGQESPTAQYITTYMAGDDLYDESFSIDSSSGKFLGECGVGIAETIGVGDPKKVTAFEVWLFDNNDIQTVTKVLMSEHAHNDPAMMKKLEAKGELTLLEPGKTILLETARLQLVARAVDSSYGRGALPENSFFDRLTLELAVWEKPEQQPQP